VRFIEWRKWWHRQLRSRRASRTGPSRRARSRPQLEVFEERDLLSAGALDPSFGTGGKVTTAFGIGPLNSSAAAIAVQPDGKVVAVGSAANVDTSDFALARYNPDGSLDAGFGTSGRVTTHFGFTFAKASGVALQADGKIVVVGGTSVSDPNGGFNFALARYNPDGSLDVGFGTAGTIVTHFASGAAAAAVTLQADGKIIVVGSARNAPSYTDTLSLARYNPDGSLDPSFASGVQVSFMATSVTLQPDGKILMAGESGSRFGLLRLTRDGMLDTGFGANGLATTVFDASCAGSVGGVAYSIALQPDGKIVLGGKSTDSDVFGNLSSSLALARYNSDGSLDTSFGMGGKVTGDCNSKPAPGFTGIALQGNGKIVAVGLGDNHFVPRRYNGDGSLDGAFGTGSSGVVNGTPNGLALDARGKIIAVGTNGMDFVLARYNADGNLDTSFGQGGQLTTDFLGPISMSAADGVLQADGKIVVVGSVMNGSTSHVALSRYNPDGRLDPTFGTSGRVPTVFAGTGNDVAHAAVLQPDGKIVVAGSADGDLALARYNSNGTLDTSFGSGGKVVTSITREANAYGLVIQPTDGKIVVVGTISHPYVGTRGFRGTCTGVALARYNPDGSRDPSFGTGGIVSYDCGAFITPFLVSANAVALQADGKIVVAGYELARYNPNGSPDPTFGTGGKVRISFGAFLGLALQDNGQIVTVGSSGLTRFNADGSLDSRFGSFGSAPTPFAASKVVVLPNGLIVMVGSSGSNGSAFALAVYNSEGRLDSRFGTGGKVTTDFAGQKASGTGVVIQADGKIVVVGSAANDKESDFALARYEGLASINDNNAFVAGSYRDLLGRPADAAGLANFQQGLDTARVPLLSSIATAYVTSAENRANLIKSYYTTFLGRSAGMAEVNSWLQSMQQGATPAQVLAAIVSSQEAFQKQGSNTAWLDQVYQGLLGRNRDPGSQGFLDCLNNSTCTRQDVASAILGNTEYQSRFITNTYTTYLGRAPADVEINLWLPLLKQPAAGPSQPSSQEQFVAAILSSGEYFQNQGGTDQAWIHSLYAKLLGRPADPAGFTAGLLGMVNSSTAQRQSVTSALVTSDEYRRNLVAGYYSTLLGRAAGASETDFWASSLQRGTSDEQVLNGIVSSDEYFTKAGGTNSQWLDRLYRDLLGRARGVGEDFFLNALNNGSLSRAQAATGILSSTEYRQHLIQTFYSTYLGRPGAADELNFWTQLLQQGSSDEQVRAAILASAEYFLRPHLDS
jgi:uncharacterized delta-60 repeat protein